MNAQIENRIEDRPSTALVTAARDLRLTLLTLLEQANQMSPMFDDADHAIASAVAGAESMELVIRELADNAEPLRWAYASGFLIESAYGLTTQVWQMKSLFDDNDGTIGDALDDVEESIPVVEALIPRVIQEASAVGAKPDGSALTWAASVLPEDFCASYL